MTTATLENSQPFAAESDWGARESWPVRRARAEKLKASNSITDSQFEEFTQRGAIGSHLENLQRKGGFKGFNHNAVSIIIAETDPRLQKGS